MKTKLVKTLRGAWKAGLILFLVFFLTILFGCAEGIVDAASTRETDPGEGDNPPLEDLSAELEKRILQDYFDFIIKPNEPEMTVNDIWVSEYYGIYNGCVVLNIHGFGWYPNAPNAMEDFVIAGVKFYFETSKIPMVWKDGQFYGYEHDEYGMLYTDWASGGTLRAAYDSGLLTQDNLRSIAGYINSEEEEEGPITFEGLNAETQRHILQDYSNYSFRIFGDMVSVDDYKIYEYFGTHNDYVMVAIGVYEKILWKINPFYPAAPPPRVYIADWWYYDCYYYEDIIAWKNGQLYEVADLYNNGNLTLDDLRNIASLNPGWKLKEPIIEGLSAETQKQILSDYFNYPLKDLWFAEDFKIENIRIEDYKIYGYYGTYNDYVMVCIGIDKEFLRENIFIYPAAVWGSLVIIADWHYRNYFCYEPTIAWKNGQIFKVTDLYDNGNLTLDDLRNIASLNPWWRLINELR